MCFNIGFEWMLQQTSDWGSDSESDGEIVTGVQKQTSPVTAKDVVDVNRGGKVQKLCSMNIHTC